MIEVFITTLKHLLKTLTGAGLSAPVFAFGHAPLNWSEFWGADQIMVHSRPSFKLVQCQPVEKVGNVR